MDPSIIDALPFEKLGAIAIFVLILFAIDKFHNYKLMTLIFKSIKTREDKE